jgi:hypothetical protein
MFFLTFSGDIRHMRWTIGLVLLCALLVAVTDSAIAKSPCGDAGRRAERFGDLFVADRGPIRKWSLPIKVFVTGEEDHVAKAQALFRYYSENYGIPIVFVEDGMDIYLAITNNLYATLLEHGEVIFTGFYSDIPELYELLKESAVKDKGYISKNRFKGPRSIASVLVVGTDFYEENYVEAVLNSLIINTLFPGIRRKTFDNGESIFFKARPAGEIDDCTSDLMKQFYDRRLRVGMDWLEARRIIVGDSI